MRKIVLLAALAVLVVLPVRAQVSGVSAQLSLDEQQYIPGEDIQLKVSIMNRSGQPITFGTDNDWLTVTILDDGNVSAPKTGDMPVQGEFSLQSGELGVKTVNPAPYFNLDKMGHYRILATVKIPQWNQEITCKPVAFAIGYGVPVLNMANLSFGVPPAPGESNSPPVVRSYSLLKANHLSELKLYFRLTDSYGKIIRVFPLARMLSFSSPEEQVDRLNNLHVLSQTGARDFIYCVLGTDGQWIERQTYVYTDTRPVLHTDNTGDVYVLGGARQLSMDDYPPASPVSARQ
jgi:hypothetical protein